MSKVILDTDIGNDIDDAVALAYLLGKPGCDLIGITTVTGEAPKRAALCEMICRAAGREDIPIHCGQEEPLESPPGISPDASKSGPSVLGESTRSSASLQPTARHYEAVNHLPHRLDRPLDTAVDFLRKTIRENPGEITLLSIGPLTNIALLVALDSEIPFLLKGFVSMAGAFFPPLDYAEWNIRCDPLAAQFVYAAPKPAHRSVGLDVTLKCQMHADEVRTRFTGEPLSTVAQMAEQWFQHSKVLTFHDPLAAATIFRPDLCQYETGSITADPDTAMTTLKFGEGPDEAAYKVDPEAFFQEFFSVF